jgi:hypothetical protein
MWKGKWFPCLKVSLLSCKYKQESEVEMAKSRVVFALNRNVWNVGNSKGLWRKLGNLADMVHSARKRLPALPRKGKLAVISTVIFGSPSCI